MIYRTHNCQELRLDHVGEIVMLSGWVNSVRDQGGVIFVDLRDREGITQVVFRQEESPEAVEVSHRLRDEDVIQVTGKVEARIDGTANEKLATGGIELLASEVKILSKAAVLPFQLDKALSNEDLRLRYRYLDLRRPRLAANMKMRHQLTKLTRDYLDECGFLEIETPILSKSTPEGARDFLVPARLQPGSFYALPQAPQQYKQLCMVAGLDRYFQIARCFRDEDLRADRQLEFTQVDIEASFIDTEYIYALIETLVAKFFTKATGREVVTPFPRLSWKEAMDRFGSDKPERRIGMELKDVGDIFGSSTFKVFRGTLDSGGVVKALNAKGFACITTGQINTLTEVAQRAGAKGLAFIKVENGEWKSPIVKFFTEGEKLQLTERLAIEEGDLILFGADAWSEVCDVLGRIRLAVAEMQDLTKGNEEFDFLWVTEFPLLAYSVEDDRWVAVHHPFTRPHPEDLELLERGDYANVRALAYDVVLNGCELGGGSIRIHESDLQRKMFDVLGITPEEQITQFGHILEAFSFGAPPHGGLALGLDRMVMLACGEESIREVIAFPKNNRGQELLTGSPSVVDPKQIRDLGIQLKNNDKSAV